MSKVFHHVSTRSNWGWWDDLEGRDLAHGDEIEVLWPDGSRTTQRVRVIEGSRDIGREGVVPDHRAFIDVIIRGCDAAMPLRGSPLKAARRP